MNTELELEDGKYRIVRENNGYMTAFRHGEAWRDLTGDKLVGAMVDELMKLRKTLAAQPSPGGRGNALVDTARRNIRQFISKASFSSAVDKQAALSCVDVLEEAIAALEAALPHLAAPEAGNPVSVSERERFEAWARSQGWADDDLTKYGLGRCVTIGEYHNSHLQGAWIGWQAALAARQPVGEVAAYGFRYKKGGAFTSTFVRFESEVERVKNSAGFSEILEIVPLYAAPSAQQPAQVDLEQFRNAVVAFADRMKENTDFSMDRGHNRDIVEYWEAKEKEAKSLLVLIDSQGKRDEKEG